MSIAKKLVDKAAAALRSIQPDTFVINSAFGKQFEAIQLLVRNLENGKVPSREDIDGAIRILRDASFTNKLSVDKLADVSELQAVLHALLNKEPTHIPQLSHRPSDPPPNPKANKPTPEEIDRFISITAELHLTARGKKKSDPDFADLKTRLEARLRLSDATRLFSEGEPTQAAVKHATDQFDAMLRQEADAAAQRAADARAEQQRLAQQEAEAATRNAEAQRAAEARRQRLDADVEAEFTRINAVRRANGHAEISPKTPEGQAALDRIKKEVTLAEGNLAGLPERLKDLEGPPPTRSLPEATVNRLVEEEKAAQLKRLNESRALANLPPLEMHTPYGTSGRTVSEVLDKVIQDSHLRRAIADENATGIAAAKETIKQKLKGYDLEAPETVPLGASPTIAAVRAGGTPTNLVRQLANPLIHSVGSAIPIPNTGKMPVWPKPRYGKQAGRPKIIQAAQAKIFEQLQARGFKLGISTELRASVADQLGKQVFAEFPNKKEIGFLGRRLRHHHHVEMPRSYDVWVSHTDGAVTDIRIVPSTDTITMSSFGRSTPGIALLGTVAMYAGAGALIASEEAGVAEREAPPSPAYYRALNIQQRIEQGLAGTVQGAVGLTIDNAPAGLGTLVWRAAEGSLPYLGMADRLKAIRGNFRAYDPVQANDQEAVTSTALDQLIITSVTRELYKQLKNPALNFQALHGREGTGSQRIASLANSFLVTDNPTGHPFAGTIQAQRAYSNGQGWIDIGRIIGKGEKVTLPVRVTTPQGVVTAYVPGTLEGQIQFAAAPDEKTPNALYINPHTGPVAEIQARQLYFTPQSGDRAGERIPVAPGYSSTVPIYLPGTMAQRVANHVVIATSGREVRLHDAHRLPGSQATWDRYWGSVMDRFAPLLPPPEARRGPQRTGDAETTPGAVNLATANIPTEVTAAHAKPDRPTQVEVTFHSGLTPSGAG